MLINEGKGGLSCGFSPLDTERRLVNMKRGSIRHGSYSIFQMGYLRPNESCFRYRMPIKGLYVGGASVYLGGMILLGSGYSAAKVYRAEGIRKSILKGRYQDLA